MAYSKYDWSEIYPRLLQKQSLNKISSELNMNKSTLYYHYRKLFDKRTKDIVINFVSDEEIGELIGVFVGDGGYSIDKYGHYHISFYFSADEVPYTESISNFLSKRLGKAPNRYICPSCPSKIILRYSSKLLIGFIKSYISWNGAKKSKSVSLQGTIGSYPDSFCIGFIRGLLDTDGYAGKYRRVTLSTASPYLNSQTKEILDRFGIRYTQYINTYANNKKMKKTGGKWGPQYNLNIRGPHAVELIHLLHPRNQKRIRRWALPS